MSSSERDVATKHCERCNGSGEVEGYGGNMIYCGHCAGSGRTLDTSSGSSDVQVASREAARQILDDWHNSIRAGGDSSDVELINRIASALRSRKLAVWEAAIQIVEDYDSLTAAAWDIKYGDVELRDALAAKAQSFRKEGE